MSGQYQRKDHLYKKAKEEGYRSRAAYKLLELDQKYQLLRPGLAVLDLGSFPGGWLQVAQERVGQTGRVVGVDIREVEPVEVIVRSGGQSAAISPTIVIGDITEAATQLAIVAGLQGAADVLLSDMSPQLTGIRFRDVARSAELVETALRFADQVLRPGGAVITKVFPGSEIDELFRAYSARYERLSRLRLKSTRKSSDEMYFIGKGFRGSS